MIGIFTISVLISKFPSMSNISGLFLIFYAVFIACFVAFNTLMVSTHSTSATPIPTWEFFNICSNNISLSNGEIFFESSIPDGI